ncbi:MAG: hypothetical protein ABJJ44_13395 [Paraglaciecola sp.]|uniref:hypothetical protein n=1 Tax=Paraglaciecola sp. TaxID=1920173 RepID=UPI0032984984
MNKVIFFFILLCSVHFFGLHFRLGEDAYDLIDFTYFGLAFLLLGKLLAGRVKVRLPASEFVFGKAIFLLFCALIISSLSGYYYHQQNPLLTLLAMRYFLYFLVFFCLIVLGVSKEYLVKVVIVFAFFYMAVFSLQLILFPTAIVPLGRIEGFDRGFLRLRLEGVGFITLTAFYALNQFLKSKQTKYILLYLLCFTFVFILGFRTLLATFLVSSLLLAVAYEKFAVKRFMVLCSCGLLVLGLLLIPDIQNYLLAMLDTTTAQVEQGDNYIRVRTFDFYFNQVNVDFGSLLLGNGQPFYGTPYGNYVFDYGVLKNGFIMADLGLLGFMFNYGVLGGIAFLNIYRIAIFKKLPKDSIYLNIYFFYMVVSSITTAEIFRAGIFGVQMIGLYLIAITCFEQSRKHISTK